MTTTDALPAADRRRAAALMLAGLDENGEDTTRRTLNMALLDAQADGD
jgi:hypothetical protein